MRKKGKAHKILSRLAGALGYVFALLAGSFLILTVAVSALEREVSPEEFTSLYALTPDTFRSGFLVVFALTGAVCLLFCLLWRALKRNGLRPGSIRRRPDMRADGLPELPEDEQGRALISLTLKDADALFSPYVINGMRTLRPDLAQSIDDEAQRLSDPKEAVLEIRFSEPSAGPAEKDVRAVSDSFLARYLQIRKKWKQNMIVAAGIAGVGLTFLLFMDALQSVINLSVTSQLLEVVSSVLLWQAMGLFFLENRQTRKTMERWRMLADMEVRILTELPSDENG